MDTDVVSERVRVLVAVDGSDVSEQAAVAAHRLFGDDADYLLLNVGRAGRGTGSRPEAWAPPGRSGTGWPTGTQVEPGSPAEHLMEEVAEHAHLDHPETLAAAGEVVRTIVRAAHDHSADVIAIGSHDRSWFSRLVDPSTSQHIVSASDLPVVVVRPGTVDIAGPDHRPYVVIATDGSEASSHAARMAVWLVSDAARYEVLHVAPERPDPNADATGFAGPLIDDEEADEIQRETLVRADAIVAETAREIGPVPVTQTVLEGDAIVQLCTWPHQQGADLLVIGSTGSSGLLHVLLGSVSHQVIAHSEVPLLVVPAAR